MADTMTKKGSDNNVAEPGKRKLRTRSPAYPGINLESAIKRAKEYYDHDKMNAAPLQVVVKHWGFKEKSSGGLVTAAALISFGLMKDSGAGAERKFQLSEEARRILLDQRQNSSDREEAIKQAALRPKIYAALWKKWGNDLPSEENFRHELIVERGFNENAVGNFIKLYKDTINYAKLTASDTLSAGDKDTEEESEVGASEEVSRTEPADNAAFLPPRKGQNVMKEISMPVGLSEEGQAVFAHVRFDAPLKKEFLGTLRTLLDALEKTLK